MLLLLDFVDDQTRDEILELKMILDKLWIRVDLSENDCGACLSINYDMQDVEKKQSRNAGRKLIDLGGVTVGDVRRMQETMSVCEMCNKLGISRATYFRRLKMHEHSVNDIHF